MTMKHWIIAGGAVAVAALGLYSYQAKAADLGRDCGCADLEERLAELEAVATHKGNRKVKLTVSGYVSHSIMHWDDGTTSDTYIGDGGAISSRFRFQGEAKVKPDLTAGFTYEFGINNNALGSMTQGLGGDDLGGQVALRDSTVWLRHKNLGRVKVGHGSTATDNLILIDTSGADAVMTSDVGLFNGAFSTGGGLTWGAMLNGGISFDTARRNHVSWQSPTLAGFMLEAAVAENSFWDVALRYAGEFGGFRVAAGVGYSSDEEMPTFGVSGFSANRINETKGSASVLHVSSGLFVTGAAGRREFEGGTNAYSAGGCILFFCVPGTGTGTSTPTDATFWHVSAGLSKNLTGIGSTVFFGEMHNAKDMVGATGMWDPSGPAPNAPFEISSDANVWGLGIVQHIDAAAMQVFLSYKNFSGDVKSTGANGPLPDTYAIKDFSAIIAGAKISF